MDWLLISDVAASYFFKVNTGAKVEKQQFKKIKLGDLIEYSLS